MRPTHVKSHPSHNANLNQKMKETSYLQEHLNEFNSLSRKLELVKVEIDDEEKTIVDLCYANSLMDRL